MLLKTFTIAILALVICTFAYGQSLFRPNMVPTHQEMINLFTSVDTLSVLTKAASIDTTALTNFADIHAASVLLVSAAKKYKKQMEMNPNYDMACQSAKAFASGMAWLDTLGDNQPAYHLVGFKVGLESSAMYQFYQNWGNTVNAFGILQWSIKPNRLPFVPNDYHSEMKEVGPLPAGKVLNKHEKIIASLVSGARIAIDGIDSAYVRAAQNLATHVIQKLAPMGRLDRENYHSILRDYRKLNIVLAAGVSELRLKLDSLGLVTLALGIEKIKIDSISRSLGRLTISIDSIRQLVNATQNTLDSEQAALQQILPALDKDFSNYFDESDKFTGATHADVKAQFDAQKKVVKLGLDVLDRRNQYFIKRVRARDLEDLLRKSDSALTVLLLRRLAGQKVFKDRTEKYDVDNSLTTKKIAIVKYQGDVLDNDRRELNGLEIYGFMTLKILAELEQWPSKN
jgi:hypothetical protein